METINNIKDAATKAIWGNDQAQHQEPVSGKTGDVSKGEPYDAGNMEPEEPSTKSEESPTKFGSTAPDETGTQPVEAGTPSHETGSAPVDTKLSQPDELNKHLKSESDKQETGSAPVDDKLYQPKELNKHLESEFDKHPEQQTFPIRESKPQHESSIQPTEVKDSSMLKGDSTKAQIDVRDPTDPNTQHDNTAPKNNVDDTTGGLDVGNNPEKLDGPGPKPIEVIAKEHGGDAGKTGSEEKLTSNEGGAPLDRRDSGHEEGTGELYVKSSGLKADGGDFDAAAPGAGREADRLLDAKGIHRDNANGSMIPNKGTEADGHANGHANGSAKEKISLKDKIKNKLHRHSDTASS